MIPTPDACELCLEVDPERSTPGQPAAVCASTLMAPTKLDVATCPTGRLVDLRKLHGLEPMQARINEALEDLAAVRAGLGPRLKVKPVDWPAQIAEWEAAWTAREVSRTGHRTAGRGVVDCLLFVDRWVRVEPQARALDVVVEACARALDLTAGWAERYAASARWWAAASRCLP